MPSSKVTAANSELYPLTPRFSAKFYLQYFSVPIENENVVYQTLFVVQS